ncbi:HAD family acid phosphatase [Streptomyces sp. BB1-1-1]|uniref:HAD family acid phosphatase n=1 Tax=Streptomyces sp. BB1-1-1 TaxID=3074430 RepID=UPI0028780E8E|nr:HAD family acid phosphatase [Streptomyces sp. BB1-1-1]WND37875.1 HAD family acid phosphatase [Streptomyces sp. BB1-1-1]
MRKSFRAASIATACALAGGALWGTGIANAGTDIGAPSSRITEARSGNEPPNIGQLVAEIDAYYGITQDDGGVYRASADSDYAKDVADVLAKAKRDIKRQAATSGRTEGDRPAIVLDIDDTVLLSIDYEKRTNYTYNDATWNAYVERADRPAVFGVPGLIEYAKDHGVAVFFLTGLAEDKREAAIENLTKVGVDAELDADHAFFKNKADPPSYLGGCATAEDWNCTTVQYKAGTRKYIESTGYDIIGSFGDQYSDLKGGYADKLYKLPNPSYFVD